MISSPYLLYLGAATDPLAVKTARGVAEWRPETCIGQLRLPGCEVTLGLEDVAIDEAVRRGARTLIIGEANAGGVLSAAAIPVIVAALDAGLDVASGLHQRLGDVPAVREAAERNGRRLFDVRQPPADLVVGKGVPRAGMRLLTVGTDCSMGKMYTSLALEKALRARGVAADFRATGQTGILIAGDGIAVDAVVADFISGATERVSPARHDGGWDIIEGQGSLFHPSYAGVSLGLLHGAQPDALVLCHEPGRPHMRGVPGHPVPGLKETLERNLEAARLTNPDVVAVGVAFNTSAYSDAEAARLCAEASAELNLPCQDPVRMGVDQIVDKLLSCFEASPSLAAAGR
ncbi:N-acetyltransferase DgcN [Caulobacter mirabilis]|uniref:EBNA-1 nuclear protein n=1 Tax=Caulobacter mirabilis TaxID=69666 RepID=A0A2D2B1R2_9CAUL|nr:N-acetyltransferase DgcN [Caulobacter mirabilis]ATQ44199.1 EBNA-1 nuclear protein [Caulobacter mirabilis]